MKDAGPPRSPVRREPRQERSRVLVQSLLEAARRILEREGAEALNTNHIAEVAGVSIGSLYQYFEDKESIVEAIILAEEQRALEQRVAWAAEAMELPLDEMFHLFVERIVEQHRQLLALHEGLYRRHREHTDMRVLGDARVAPLPNGKHVVEMFLHSWCEQHREEIRSANLEYVAFLLDRVGYAMIRSTVDERAAYLDDPAFVDEMVQMMVRYLRR